MESNSSPAMGLFVFWLMLQLVLMIALLVGGIYVLYCLGRAANGLDRLASAAEEWVRQQSTATPRHTEVMPPSASLLRPATPTPAPPVASTPPVASAPPLSSTPPATSESSSTIRPSF